MIKEIVKKFATLNPLHPSYYFRTPALPPTNTQKSTKVLLHSALHLILMTMNNRIYQQNYQDHTRRKFFPGGVDVTLIPI